MSECNETNEPPSAEGERKEQTEVPEHPVVAAAARGTLQQLSAAIVAAGKQLNLATLVDEHGMTPLQHAAYRGTPDAVRLLLEQGSDVNYSKHEYNYTALHFGALSGNAEVCQLLMLAGVKTDAKNSVGRTAAQMAGFVGNYGVVAKVNNFIPRSDVDYYTKPRGTETAPLLPPVVAEPFHKFITDVNLNPVRVALNLQRSSLLSEHLPELKKALEAMCEKEMTKGGDKDEIISFKLHYLSYLVGEIHDVRQRHSASKEQKKDEHNEEKKTDFVELFSKKLLKPGKDGVSLDYQDSFLNEGVRKFPFRQSMIFRQAVQSLARTDAPSTLSVIDAAINGQRGFVDSLPYCITCGEEKPAKKCSKCKSVQYCDRECQRLHWFVHKKACARLASNPAPPPQQVHHVDPTELLQVQNLSV